LPVSDANLSLSWTLLHSACGRGRICAPRSGIDLAFRGILVLMIGYTRKQEQS
jgi:hypothetical protein